MARIQVKVYAEDGRKVFQRVVTLDVSDGDAIGVARDFCDDFGEEPEREDAI